MIGRFASAATVACIGAMALAPVASAGGFATVGLTSPPPNDVQVGEAWEARFTLLSHGLMPSSGAEPLVRIEPASGGTAQLVRATETDVPGTYRARVVFPADGRWAVEVREHPDFPGHAFGEVRVGESASAASSDGPGSGAALAAALALGLLAGGVAWLVQRGLVAPRSTAAAR